MSGWEKVDRKVLKLIMTGELPPSAVQVYSFISLHSWQRCTCTARMSVFCEETGLSRSSVKNAKKALVEAGLIEIKQRFGKGGQLTDEIVLCKPTEGSAGGQQDGPLGGQQIDPLGGQQIDPQYLDTLSTNVDNVDSKGPSRTRTHCGMPPHWEGETCPDWALEIGHKHDIQGVAQVWYRFFNHHAAKGSRFKDWKAAWRKWVSNEQKWSNNDKRTDSERQADARDKRRAAMRRYLREQTEAADGSSQAPDGNSAGTSDPFHQHFGTSLQMSSGDGAGDHRDSEHNMFTFD